MNIPGQIEEGIEDGNIFFGWKGRMNNSGLNKNRLRKVGCSQLEFNRNA